MATNFCSQCGTRLEEGAAFCHGCGHDLTRRGAATPPPAGIPPAPAMAPPMMYPMQPWGMLPAPGGEPPVREVGHERAVAAVGGIVMLCTSALVIILGIIFLTDLAWEWGEDWEGEVFMWEYGLAGIFMVASTGVGIAGAIGAFTMRRFKLALLAAVMLLVSSSCVIASYDPGSMAFFPILGAVGLLCVLLARTGFVTQGILGPGGPVPLTRAGYGKESGVP